MSKMSHRLIHRQMMQPKRQQELLRKMPMTRQLLIMKSLLAEAWNNLREDSAFQ
jgi:hypothetical protein